ncbi:MAG: ABC transporter ATP-binding protein [Erysipelotrichaceae bacterium]|nr:ABC transporter ATP-binding protein [Erysipelotrichaceae bacterium]
MIKRFISYYKPHLKIFMLDMLASFLVAIIGLVYPIITRKMIGELIPNKQLQDIMFWGSVLLALYGVRALLKYYIQYQGHVMGVRMQADMRRELFAHLQKLPYKYYDEHETGKIMSRMTNDLMDVSEFAHHGPENVFICGFLVVATCIYLATINVYLTFIIFLCVPLLLTISVFMRKRMKDAFMESRKNVAVINATLENSISGIRVTKAFTNSLKEEEKFEDGNQRYVASRSKAFDIMGQFGASTAFITDLFNVVVLVGGGLFMAQGQIDAADFSAFIVSVNMFISPLTTLIGFAEMYQNGMTGFTRFVEILDEPVEAEDKDAIELGDIKGDIKFENVTFAYNEEGNVLEDINLEIESGKKLALVGQSGGGKTTICHLIPNFYSIDQGSITIDGIDIRKISLESLRKNIGIVQQDVFLFNGTVKENILYGRLDATDEEVIEAAKRANIHEYVMQMPNGYDTQIGERGVRLSGGQKQRLSIARVFLKNPSILILDEATSALDNTTELLIQNALDALCEGRTTIVVAHRLSTVKNADEIAVINRGKIIEKGTHEELLQIDEGVYKELYEQQFVRKTSEKLQSLVY